MVLDKNLYVSVYVVCVSEYRQASFLGVGTRPCRELYLYTCVQCVAINDQMLSIWFSFIHNCWDCMISLGSFPSLTKGVLSENLHSDGTLNVILYSLRILFTK